MLITINVANMQKLLVRVLSKLRLLDYFNFQISHSDKGKTVVIPIIKSLGKENLSLTELWMSEVIYKLLKIKKGTFIDVGVNVGQTLIKLKLINREIAYLGFDPNPVCIFYTRELIRSNRFSNTDLVPVGISDSDQIATLYFYSDGNSDSSASIVKDFRPQTIFRREFVPCFGGDGIRPLLENQAISIIKIDVEGAESMVLKGIKEVVADQRPFILIEILPVYSVENKERMLRQNEIENLMKSLEYKLLRIRKSNEEFDGFTILPEIGINTRIEDSDYLLCPAELVSLIS